VDSFVQGGAGEVDSVLRAGLTWNFGTLPENRELVLWLREHNAHAVQKVHFYGFDLTGADPANLADLYLGAPLAVRATLDYLRQVAPTSADDLDTTLRPLLSRFTPYRYAEYSSDERARVTAGLRKMDRMLVADSSRYVQASSPRAYAWAARNAWMALRLNELLAMGASNTPAIAQKRSDFRDSLMVENIRWVVHTEGDSGRVVVFAHDAHVMNSPLVAEGVRRKMAGQHLRAVFGAKEVVVASTTSSIVGFGDVASNPGSLDAALATVGLPTFVLDLRTANRNPAIAAMLDTPWPFRIHTYFQSVIPREATDAIVYFDKVTRTKDMSP
jgi:erythromycin esterase-like protein